MDAVPQLAVLIAMLSWVNAIGEANVVFFASLALVWLTRRARA